MSISINRVANAFDAVAFRIAKVVACQTVAVLNVPAGDFKAHIVILDSQCLPKHP